MANTYKTGCTTRRSYAYYQLVKMLNINPYLVVRNLGVKSEKPLF